MEAKSVSNISQTAALSDFPYINEDIKSYLMKTFYRRVYGGRNWCQP